MQDEDEDEDETTAYTTGPWKYKKHRGARFVYRLPDDYAICRIEHTPIRTKGISGEAREIASEAKQDANGNLIAASPELFEACMKTIEYLNSRADSESNALWGLVSAACRKALGEVAG